ncbi:MAG: 4Fe-4S binding protein [Anaerolineales bacterium]
MPRPKHSRGRSLLSWFTFRRATQVLALFAALVLVIGTGRAGWAGSSGAALFQLDPLTALAQVVAGRALFPGAALALILVAMTLLLGRVWCGWLCPMGTLLDLLPMRRWRRRKAPSEAWRKAKYVLLLLILFAALFANLSLLIFDPLTLFVRTVSSSVLPPLDRLTIGLETALYRLPALRGAVKWVDDVLRPALLPRNPAPARAPLLFAALLVGIVALNLLAERFWCRYLCPLGGLLGLLSKIGLIRREPNDQCTGCELCTRVCPTGTVQPENGYASDPAECIMCMDCQDACPRGAQSFPMRVGLAPWNEYDPQRRHFLASLAASVAGVGLLRLGSAKLKQHRYWIQPPGARENDLLRKCVRCGICVGVCPTGSLQPALTEAGVEGVWTPVLVPRMGYCHYACNECGQRCPVGAIPPLSIDQKVQTVIGLAVIDQDRCIAWAEDGDCIVCEEMCPLPEKAIELEEEAVDHPVEGPRTVLRPKVILDRCIGCGYCEQKCPVEGEAAIRVQNPATL